MNPFCVHVHPVYGAIYKEGEFVQRGAVLGLSVDSREVVTAPGSGWVHLPEDLEASVRTPTGIRIEIWQQAAARDQQTSMGNAT